MSSTYQHLLLSGFIGLALLSQAAPVQALIAGSESHKGGATPEFVLVIFDRVKEVSYTKDLGIYAAPFDETKDNSNNFFVQAQQDGGYQKFFDPLNNDVNFQEFLKTSSDSKNQAWGIYASGVNDEYFFGPGSTNFFMTLNSNWIGGGENPSWTTLMAMTNGSMVDTAQILGQRFFGDLNNRVDSETGAQGSAFNSHYKEGFTLGVDEIDFADLLKLNGSSFDKKGTFPYFPNIDVGYQPDPGIVYLGGQYPDTMNPVGTSSWFYYVTPSSDDVGIAPLVDEFDNLGHDGYWGLAVNDAGEYILSFTMEAHMTAASTAQGLARRNRTDFSALYGGVRSLSTPADEFIGWTPSSNFGTVTAVPEPATYGLFGLGLAALAWRRRQVRKA